MRVVFLEDVAGVAQGGDVKEVKNGFARNYLIPKNLAVPATHNALQQIKSIAERAEVDRTRALTDMRAVAEALEGTQINIEMRSGVNNRLYGSVTNAVIAEELSNIADREIDRRTIMLAEPIRELGLFEVFLKLHQDVEVPISVLVYPIGADVEAALAVARGEEVASEDIVEEEPSVEAAEDVASEDPVEEPEASVEDDADEEADAEETAEESEQDDVDSTEHPEEEAAEPVANGEGDAAEEDEEDKES